MSENQEIAENVDSSGGAKVKWYKSMSFLGLLGLTLIPLWDMGGIIIVMNTRGQDLVVAESARLIEQLGNNAITNIRKRSEKYEALCRGLATLGENLPRKVSLFRTVIPRVIDFDGDDDVAGGGIWPEPGAFTPGVEKRSFFWAREKDGRLKYLDDYNSGRGYHKDEWYPVVQFSRPGRCFWSKSYMDPYSYQPMVTCTVAMRRKGKFSGVATVDLKLEGLQVFLEEIRAKTGGYIFLLDRNNKFLTFPKPELVKLTGKDAKGNKTEEFLTAGRFAEKEKRFKPIATAVEAMNLDILKSARAMKASYRPDLVDRIDGKSDQINKEEAKFIAAVIADPLAERLKQSNLYKKFTIPADFYTKEESIVFLFHVPGSYWKVVVVKPISQARAVASAISRVIVSLIAVTILVGVIVAAWLLHVFFTRPMKETTLAVQRVGQLVEDKKFTELDKNRIERKSDDELGQLAGVINSLSSELQRSYGSLMDLNTNLEHKVEERTEKLQATLKEVSELKFQQDGDYYLTSLLIGPLGRNKAEGETVEVDFLLRQKKNFEFRRWKEEIGGDICIAHSIHLRDKPYTVFLNADAMGKSMQGAGGALVLGAVFQSLIERTKLASAEKRKSPERWLKSAFVELQKVFESFNGLMLISVVMGLVDDGNGFVYYVNAEHPQMVLHRGGQASFIRGGVLRKLGTPSVAGNFRIETCTLRPGDVLIMGSDGRDDLVVGTDEAGHRIINEDENAFLRHVEQGHGRLEEILTSIQGSGELTDDFSLLRLVYLEGGEGEGRGLTRSQGERLRAARNAVKADRATDAIRELERLLSESPDYPPVLKSLARAHLKAGDYVKAAGYSRRYTELEPGDLEYLFITSYSLRKAGQFSEAVDFGERCRLRSPGMLKNLRNLAAAYRQMNNSERASIIAAEADAVEELSMEV